MRRAVIWLMVIMSLGNAGIGIPTAFSADFLQKITNPKKKVIIYKGKVLMSVPDNMKWSYREPTKKEVCSNGKFIVVVDHDLEQVSFYRMEKSFDLTKVLRQARHYKDNIYVTKYQGKNYTIVTNTKGQVDQIAYRDEMGNVINIHFSKIRYLKTPFKERQLMCAIPKGYDKVGK